MVKRTILGIVFLIGSMISGFIFDNVIAMTSCVLIAYFLIMSVAFPVVIYAFKKGFEKGIGE